MRSPVARAGASSGVLLSIWCAAGAAWSAEPASTEPVREPGAAEKTVALAWEGPSGIHDCTTPEAVQSAVEADVGHPVFRGAPAEVTLRVRVEPTLPSGFHAVLRLEDGAGRTWGQRELRTDAKTCAALTEPLVLAVTLMVDASLLAPPPAASDAAPEPPSSRPEAPPRLEIRNPTPAPEPAEPPEPWTSSFDAQFLASAGLLPGLAFGGEVGAEAIPPGWPALRARAALFPGRERSVEPEGVVRFRVGYAGLAVCPELSRGARHAVGLCLGGDVGFAHARSDGLSAATETTRVFLQGALTLRAAIVVSKPWFLRATASLLPPARTDRFVVEQADGTDELVFQRAPAAFILGIGGGVDLGR